MAKRAIRSRQLPGDNAGRPMAELAEQWVELLDQAAESGYWLLFEKMGYAMQAALQSRDDVLAVSSALEVYRHWAALGFDDEASDAMRTLMATRVLNATVVRLESSCRREES